MKVENLLLMLSKVNISTKENERKRIENNNF